MLQRILIRNNQLPGTYLYPSIHIRSIASSVRHLLHVTDSRSYCCWWALVGVQGTVPKRMVAIRAVSGSSRPATNRTGRLLLCSLVILVFLPSSRAVIVRGTRPTVAPNIQRATDRCINHTAIYPYFMLILKKSKQTLNSTKALRKIVSYVLIVV